ncbi:MAG: response regulator [Turicibacter sp.]
MTNNQNNLSILVVDDNEINLMLMEDLFEIMEIRNVKTIDSGQGAIQEIKNHPDYDIIVMDICMPQMDGYETSEYLRNLGYDGKIIALTAYDLTKEDPKFKAAQMDDIILKPIDISVIQKILCA